MADSERGGRIATQGKTIGQDLPQNQIELTNRTHIELDLELTDKGHGLAGELTEPGRPKRTIAGWLQLLDELQRALERTQPPHDDPAPR